MTDGKKYWGKYRGTVLQNIDPLQAGRLQVVVPDVMSLLPTTWAEPCVPLAGPTGPPMGVYMVPPIGAGVGLSLSMEILTARSGWAVAGERRLTFP
jgi:hypothetical protein